ncbi:MAG: DUF2065 domain-containing protein [Betaproteobacteria bacterium]|jgi:Uncharacterized protein conserved in bacteria|nr:DUF2065 domain-containing protein [Betaproteobacteria bacterium]
MLLRTLGLLLVLEGILPFLAPNGWRQTLARLSKLNDQQVRFIGVTAIVAGTLLFQMVAWLSRVH